MPACFAFPGGRPRRDSCVASTVMIELRETISVKAHWISHDQNLSIMIRTQQRHGKRTGLDTAKINCDEPESHST